MTTLNQTLRLIAKSAPNYWNDYAEGRRTDRGTDLPFDYEILDQGEHQIFYPVANNAREWFAAHLPDDCPRWGAEGYKIESQFAPGIRLALKRDKVLSEGEYVLNMELAEEGNHMAANDFAEYSALS